MPYLLSCLTNSYGRFGVEPCLKRIRSAGINHVELPIKTAGVPSIFKEDPILTDASANTDVEAVRSLFEQHRVLLSSCNISSGNPLDDEALAITLKKLQLAAQFGVSLVVAGAGQTEDATQRSVLTDHLRRIGDRAGELGITYCCETHPGLTQNADRMLETMETLDHSQMRLNFDTGNILYYNAGANVLDELRRVRDWVRHVHLKDHNGIPEDWHFPACGAGGAVNFSAIRQLLDEVGFTGPYSLEIEGIQGERPPSLDEHHQRVVDSITYLRDQGYVTTG